MGEALAAATRALARRDYSERGLRERLTRAGVEAGELEETLAELAAEAAVAQEPSPPVG